MWDFLCLHFDALANLLIITAAIGGMIFWSHKKLHAEIQEIRMDTKHANQRIDATGARIDNMYKMFMENQKEHHKQYIEMNREYYEKSAEMDKRFYEVLNEIKRSKS